MRFGLYFQPFFVLAVADRSLSAGPSPGAEALESKFSLEEMMRRDRRPFTVVTSTPGREGVVRHAHDFVGHAIRLLLESVIGFVNF